MYLRLINDILRCGVFNVLYKYFIYDFYDYFIEYVRKKFRKYVRIYLIILIKEKILIFVIIVF